MHTNIALYRSIAVTMVGLGAFLTACGDDTDGTGGGGSSTTSTSTSKSASVSASTSGSSSSSGGTMAAMLKTVNKTPFDPSKGQLPEGLALSPDGKTAYVGYAITGEIVKVTLADGTVAPFGKVPTPPPPVAGATQGLVLGLTVAATGEVYVGVGSFVVPGVFQGGVYKIAAAGGDAGAVFSKDPTLAFPNGLVLDGAGHLYVADSASATIFKIDLADGKATAWLTNDLFKGDKGNTCAAGLPFDIGANGIVKVGSDLIVGNTDKASLIKIAIKADGTADTPVVLVAPDAACTLKSLDGISADAAGNIYVAANAQNALLKVSADGKTTTKLIDKGLLDSPASIVFAKGTEGDELLVTNSGLIAAATGGTARPSLVSYGPLK